MFRPCTIVLVAMGLILCSVAFLRAATYGIEPADPGKARRAGDRDRRLDVASLRVGDVGVLSNRRDPAQLEVLSVEGEKDLQVGFDDWVQVITADPGHDNSGHYNRLYLWLRGFSTKNVATGDKVSISGYLVRVTGTQTFGGNTWLVIEPYALTKADLEAKAAAKAKLELEAKSKAEAKTKAEAARWRTWTITGKKIDARFGGCISDLVLLTRRDGSKLRVHANELSDEDQAWVNARKVARGAAKN